MHRTAVYLGPTLSVADARSVLDAEYLPPIRRGDLAKLGAEIVVVGIVDGEFYQSLAVSPKEILPLLERGVRVYGAASMGALRAAELHSCGMTGVGRIFEAYRDGAIDADDEVAVAYDPVTYRTTSVPLVNIRFALERAVEQELIDSARACELIGAVKKVYFPERSYRLVTQLCPELSLFPGVSPPDQKAEDALLLLRTLAADAFGPDGPTGTGTS
jgi:hypothetical protein